MDHLIYCQKDIPKEKWRYGLRSSAATGCGWVATFNALILMGHRPSAESVIHAYEKMLPLLHGNTGTAFFAPKRYFDSRGYKTQVVLDRKRFDDLAKEADVCILFYRWRKGIRLGAHFVALRHTTEGFVGYNTYRDSKGPDPYGASLEHYLTEKGRFGCILMGIWDKER